MPTNEPVLICTSAYWASMNASSRAAYSYHYISLAGWSASRFQNLVANSRYTTVEIHGNGWTAVDSVGSVVITTSWTTDPAHYIKITAVGEARTNGVYTNSKYRLYGATAGVSVFQAQRSNIILDGFQIYNGYTGTTARSNAFFAVNATGDDGYIQLKDMVLRGGRYTVRNEGYYQMEMDNCVVYGGTQGAVTTINARSVISLRHCICVGDVAGAYPLGGLMDAVNCYFHGETYCVRSANAGDMTNFMYKCATSNAEASSWTTEGIGNIAHSTSNFMNVAAASADYRLSSTSALKGVGADLCLAHPQRPIIDVSGITPWTDTDIIGSVLTFTNSLSTAAFRYRNVYTNTWASPELSISLQNRFVGSSQSVGIISDLHMGAATTPTGQQCFVAAINDLEDNCGATHVFVLGDVTNDDWMQHDEVVESVRSASNLGIDYYHFIPGNHDEYDTYYSDWNTNFGVSSSYLAVNIDNVMFVMAGTDEHSAATIGGGAKNYCEQILSDNQDDICFLMTHHPRLGTLRTSTRDDAVGNGFIKPYDILYDAITDNDYSAWFCAHTHGWGHIQKGQGNILWKAEDHILYDIAGKLRANTLDLGAFSSGVALLGSVYGTSGLLSRLSAIRGLAGQAVGASAVSALLEKVLSLSGLLSAVSSQSAAANVLRGLAGAISAEADHVARLLISRRLAGTSAASGGLRGRLAGGDIAGLIAASAILSGALRVFHNCSGIVQGVGFGASILSPKRGLVGAVSADAAAAGVIALTMGLEGLQAATGSAAGQIRISKTLSGHAGAFLDLAGVIATAADVFLSAAAAGNSGLSGNIERLVSLSGDVGAATDLLGALQRVANLSGNAAGLSDLSATIKRTREFKAAVSALSDLWGKILIQGEVELAGAVSAAGGQAGRLGIDYVLKALIEAEGGLSGDLGYAIAEIMQGVAGLGSVDAISARASIGRKKGVAGIDNPVGVCKIVIN